MNEFDFQLLFSKALKNDSLSIDKLFDMLDQDLLTTLQLCEMVNRLNQEILKQDKTYAIANTLLGALHHCGKGIPINFAKAWELYHIGEGLGNATAMTYLGQMHSCGQGVSVDINLAIIFYKRAIQLHYPPAMYYLARIYNGRNTFPTYHHAPNYKDAIALLERAISLGHSQAMVERAMMYNNGMGTPVDIPAARTLYESAATLENLDAMYILATIYAFGEEKQINYPAAIELLEKAIKLGSISALTSRALMYQKGYGTSINYPAAIELYERAITHHNADAMLSRGIMFLAGQGCAIDTVAGLNLIEKAISCDSDFIVAIAAGIYATGTLIPRNINKAMELYSRPCILNCSFAILELACLYLYCQDEYFSNIALEKRCAKGIALLNKAIELGSVEAKFLLGKYYNYKLDYLSAFKLYRQAANDGNIEAKNELEKNYKNIDNLHLELQYHLHMAVVARDDLFPQLTFNRFRDNSKAIINLIKDDVCLTLSEQNTLYNIFGKCFLRIAYEHLINDEQTALCYLKEIPKCSIFYAEGIQVKADIYFHAIMRCQIESKDILAAMIKVERYHRTLMNAHVNEFTLKRYDEIKKITMNFMRILIDHILELKEQLPLFSKPAYSFSNYRYKIQATRYTLSRINVNSDRLSILENADTAFNLLSELSANMNAKIESIRAELLTALQPIKINRINAYSF